MEITNLFGQKITTKDPLKREILYKQLYKILSNISLDEFVRLMTNEFNEIIQYSDLSEGENTCQKMSLLFNPHRLDTVAGTAKRSIFQSLKQESFMSGLARALLFKKNKVNELLYQVLQLGINEVQYCCEFPPHLARNIYQKYGLDAKSKILDPCAGWGGRMIGASVISNYYECFEPCTKTFNGLTKLYNFLKDLNDEFIAKINYLPFEDSNLENDYFDFALTSPPYFDTEKYSDEITNSLNRYNSFQKWCDGFYLPLIQKTMDALKPDAVFLINIGSRKYPLNEILMSNFGYKYKIKKDQNYLSGISGLGKEGEGEMFYEITKRGGEKDK